ncbi:S8 family serine peptidase [Enterovibrio norvegicus]|uniref:S8 family serine peptidase n=1 Tax=Enterovibrio norvegicus TaxID=188144 RepID=UPI003D136DD2
MHSIKHWVIGLLLLLSPFAIAEPAKKNDWLIKTSSLMSLPAAFDYHVIYQFKNGDYLLRADEENLLSVANTLFSLTDIEYIQSDLPLEKRRDISPRSASVETAQDFLSNDGFTALTQTQRQCDTAPIAIIDSGVDTLHPAFYDVHFDHAYDAIKETNETIDGYGHGTHVTGLIAAARSASMPALEGACTSATLYPIRFLDNFGGGTMADAIQSIQWAITHGARVINHSWGISVSNAALDDVISDADARDIIQVAAAGNYGRDLSASNFYPASYSQTLSGVISVANWDNTTQHLYPLSNYGNTTVDIAASGTDLLSALPNNGSRIMTGTSMAAPLVTATAAMLRHQNDALLAADIKSHILQTATAEPSLTRTTISGARLNANNALNTPIHHVAVNSATFSDDTLVIAGRGLNNVVHWEYVSATRPQRYAPLSNAGSNDNLVVFPVRTLPAGWIIAIDNDNVEHAIFIKPTLKAPQSLTLLEDDEVSILTWQGATFAEHYRVEVANSFGEYTFKENIPAPSNQYTFPQGEDISSIRVRAEYAYSSVNERQSIADVIHTSAFSTLQITQNTHTQTVQLGTIPFGSHAYIALKDINISQFNEVALSNSDNPLFLRIAEDKLEIDATTTGAKHSIIHALSDNTFSTWRFEGSVENTTEWIIPLINENTISAASTGATLNSFFEYNNAYTLRLTATQNTESLLVTLNLNNNEEQKLTSIYVNGTKLSSTSIRQTGTQTLLNLPLNQGAAEYVVSFTLAENTSGNVGAVASDSRCFVASLVFSDSPYILKHLRGFRDNVLLNLPFGDTVVAAYYAHSPFWVNTIRNNQSAIFAIQITLIFFFYLSPLLLLMGLYRKVRYPNTLKKQDSATLGMR